MVFTDNFTPTTTTTTATTSSPPHGEQDDISAFLRHLLHRSSSTSSSGFIPNLPSTTTMGMHALDNNTLFLPPTPAPASVFSGLDRILSDRSSLQPLNPSHFPVGGGSHLSSNNEYTEDCDYESEEGAEAVVEEGEARQSMSRNQSKRTRAAEVHNLSEKVFI